MVSWAGYELYQVMTSNICSKNPNESSSNALRVYGGDFHAVMDERSLWSFEDNEETQFSFEGLLKESVADMKMDNNHKGLDSVAEAIPATKVFL